jgi:N6-L-threonylcarbamoyladenine synthase
VLVLGIETSCDETGIALYHGERGLLGHVLHTQARLHDPYGGVVPELASRDHIRRVLPLSRGLLARCGCSLDQLSAVAYTQGPGLAGALLVGAAIGHGLAYALGVPALSVHHMEAHLLSPLLASPAPRFPFVALLVSGGHTELVRVEGVGRYELLGETVDDAAGEAFDKTGKLLGLGYPGGPALSKLAARGRPGRFHLPRPMRASGDLNFSFSGLKTAVLSVVRESRLGAADYPDLAAEIEAAIVDVLAIKALAALDETGLSELVVAGGVGANRSLRERLAADARARGVTVFYPPAELCTDNGAMIAFAAAMRLEHSSPIAHRASLEFTVRPRWSLESLASQLAPTTPPAFARTPPRAGGD